MTKKPSPEEYEEAYQDELKEVDRMAEEMRKIERDMLDELAAALKELFQGDSTTTDEEK
jgi:hypothetical protein